MDDIDPNGSSTMPVTDHGTLRRAPTSTRSTDSARYVSPVGFASPVHRLEGAAALVWDALDEDAEVASLAQRLGVPPDDDFLVSAIDMLVRSGLVQATTQ